MKEELGAKGGKKDLKLSFLNRKRNRKLKEEELAQEKEKEVQQQKKKEEEILLTIEKDNISEQLVTNSIEIKPKQQLSDDLVTPEKQTTDNLVSPKDNSITQKQPEHEKIINIPVNEEIKQDDILVDYPKIVTKARENDSNIVDFPTPSDTKVDTGEKEKQEEVVGFIEKQVIQILEQDIEEKKFQLKKIDSEIHTIQKNIDTATNEEELDSVEKEIERLMEMLEQIKRQILSLEKTFDFKFPVEEPDNYLIYLVEDYKEHRKEEKDFYKKLQDKEEYISLVDTLIKVETKQEMILEKMQDKKEQLGLEEEQVQKLNDDVVSIEEMNENIKRMIEQHKNVIEEIGHKVNETVHITERVEFITKSVDHTMLELFLLMGVLKHNLSIKNNAIAAATAALALDAIIKMTTPIKEKIVVKDNDFKNYETMINSCINDTNFLEQMIHNNLNQISSIRYTFEKDYSSCSYLPSYQEALQKLTSLEDDMKERKQDVARMKKDIELQLEKNNAKVKKYGSMNAA